MTSTIGIPIKLLNEGQGHIVTVEVDSGTTYRGKLIEGACLPACLPCPLLHHTTPHDTFLPSHPPSSSVVAHWLTTSCVCTAEDNMNVQLKDITVTARDGRVSHLEQVYIRGSHVRFFIVPDMLR